MATNRYNSAAYLTSATQLSELPGDDGYEVAFVGRSNAGKSSALNALTGIKNLARTSNTPGRTQMINLFELDATRRLVDLPGYGYAKVPIKVKQHWERAINDYLQRRECLCGLVLVMDVRHPLKEMDQRIVAWTEAAGVPLHVLLTKSDKLKGGAARKALAEVSQFVSQAQLFSALKRQGIEELRTVLDDWYQY